MARFWSERVRRWRLRAKGWGANGGGGGGFTPAAPIAPSESNYAIPGGATVVSSEAALETALAGGVAVDIKVLNGTYSRTAELVPAAAHRIWCETATGVVFNYGFRFNNMTGWEIHGGKFNIPDLAHAATDGAFTAAILNWIGANTVNCKISDVTIDGASVMAQGIQLGQPGGADIQRCVITNVTDNGIRASDNNTSSVKVITTISDINVAHVFRATRGSANGTAEAGLWVAHPVTNPVARIKIRDTGWMGIWTGGASANTTFTDLDIDGMTNDGVGKSMVGVYMEHLSRFNTYQNFLIGPSMQTCFNCEWDYGLSVGLSGSTTFPVATLNVNESPANFAANGTLNIGNPGGASTTVTYTGISGNSFTGCTGGSGTFAAGVIVSGTGALDGTAKPGGRGAYSIVMQNGTCGANVAGGAPIFLDNGTMVPTVTNVTFTAAAGGIAIRDRTNNPQCTNAGNSNLTQSGNTFNGLTPVGYG